MSKDKVCVAYEILDHGIDHCQYFPGCGTSFTRFDEVFTGIGDTAYEALEDALEQAAMSGWNVDIVDDQEEIAEGEGEDLSDIREQEEEDRRQEAFDEWEQERIESGEEYDEEDFEYSEDDSFADGDERHYYVSVRVREYKPEIDPPGIKVKAELLARKHDLEIETHNGKIRVQNGHYSKEELHKMEQELKAVKRKLRSLENVEPAY